MKAEVISDNRTTAFMFLQCHTPSYGSHNQQFPGRGQVGWMLSNKEHFQLRITTYDMQLKVLSHKHLPFNFGE